MGLASLSVALLLCQSFRKSNLVALLTLENWACITRLISADTIFIFSQCQSNAHDPGVSFHMKVVLRKCDSTMAKDNIF